MSELRGWFAEYRCGCLSETEKRKKDVLEYCPKHGEDARHIHPTQPTHGSDAGAGEKRPSFLEQYSHEQDAILEAVKPYHDALEKGFAPPPAPDPSGVVELQKLREHFYANEDFQPVEVLDNALALLRTQAKEIQRLEHAKQIMAGAIRELQGQVTTQAEEIERLKAIKEIAKEQACKWGTLTEALSVEFAKEPESVPGANVGDCAIAMIRRLTTQRDRLLEGMRETVSDLRMFRQMVQEGAPKSQLLEYLNRREDAIATYHLEGRDK